MIFDTHAHYDDEQFDADRVKLLLSVDQKTSECDPVSGDNAGVSAIINVGATRQGCYDALGLAREYPRVYAALGVHPDEVGTMDAVADVTAVCYLIDKLGVREIYASPVHVGKGTVRCAHGILPVPAPATAEILKDIPIYSREEINGELCTPTGAALLKRFVKQFRTMPVMKTSKIGYGMGTKDFPIANCVRAILGEDDAIARGVVRELDFNVDDMTGEEIGFLNDALLKNGAFEVFVTPVYMKKSRPGNLVTVLCSEENEEKIVELIFRHSTTIGIRETIKDRFILNRKIENVDTEFGTIRRKHSSGYGVDRSKFEYDDLAKVAEEKGLSIKEIIERIRDHE